MTDFPDLLILRHGETEWNLAGRMQGDLDAPGGFPGKVVYARPLPDVGLLAGALPAGRVPEGAWLTAMEDTSTPRPGVADVMFRRATDGAEVVPPPIHRTREAPIIVPVEIVVPLTAGLLLVAFLLLKRQRANG